MISSRWRTVSALDVTTRPPFGERAKAAIARSISPGSRTLTGLTSTPTDGATDWMTANWPIPDVRAASRRTAARVTAGAICLSNSSHFPLKLYSNCIKPVALPPGRDRLSTNPPRARGQNDVWREGRQFRRVLADGVGQALAPSIINPEVAALGPTQLLQRLHQHRVAGLHIRIIRVGAGSEYT